MDRLTVAWGVFGAYLVATTWLALRGMRRTRDLSSFALGNRDMGPLLVGITVAAATASTATFVINPGFVYAHGLSALMHFGVASVLGVAVGLIVLSKGFRRLGNESGALTLPHWIYSRFRSRAMRVYFAVLNLALAVSFVVLIVKGSALVMQHTLEIGYGLSVVVVVGFVFSYILMGGTYAHAYTNALQGSIMLVVALCIVGSGLYLFGDGIGPFVERLAAQDPNLTRAVNPASPLFGSAWEVFVCGFIVSFGLVCQPHILTKALYLKNDRDLGRYLAVAAIVGACFASILIAGLYARVELPGIAAQDAVMASYVAEAFSPLVGVLISVALLAAGMSTLDGILVSASTIAGNDLFLGGLGARFLRGKDEPARQRAALLVSRLVLVCMGAVAFVLALDPPELVGLFAQMGVYGLVAASLAPMAFGIFVRDLDTRDVFAASVVGPAVHFTHYGWVVYGRGEFLNPAVSATEGVLASVGLLAALTLWRRMVPTQQGVSVMVRVRKLLSIFTISMLVLVVAGCGPTSSGNRADAGGGGGDGGGGAMHSDWDVSDAIEYRDLDTHPGCTTEGVTYELADIPGYRCAAKAYPTTSVDTSKPLVLLVHGNSDKPTVWSAFETDSCEEEGATEGVDMLAERLLAQGFEILAVDMRHDMVDDPADDNERYNAAKNMDHGWGVPIVQHFIHSVMEAYPDRRISIVAHSFGVTTVRDALRRLFVNDGYPVWERLEDVVLLAGGNHGVSSYALCSANMTMRGRVTCQMGNRNAYTPTDFMKPLNGPGGAFETPCGDGQSAFGRPDVCGGNVVDYTTIVMQDIPDGTQQDLFVSEASSRLEGADNRLIGLNDFDESNYFFCGLLKNHFGPARALAGLAIILEKLND